MLGKKLRKKYVDTHKFLSDKYALREVHMYIEITAAKKLVHENCFILIKVTFLHF